MSLPFSIEMLLKRRIVVKRKTKKKMVSNKRHFCMPHSCFEITRMEIATFGMKSSLLKNFIA